MMRVIKALIAGILVLFVFVCVGGVYWAACNPKAAIPYLEPERFEGEAPRFEGAPKALEVPKKVRERKQESRQIPSYFRGWDGAAGC